jgi:hypothetical protein
MSLRQSNRRLYTLATREELHAIENRMVRIRKQLTQLFKVGKRGGKVSDAVQLAEAIELLARRGRVCTAAEAVEIDSHIEALSWLLQNEIDGLIVLQVR